MRNPVVERHPSEAEIAYAAGLFEGEGSVCLQKPTRNGHTPNVRLTINMTDLEPLQRIQSIFGGRVTGPYARGEGRKDMWRWCLSQVIGVRKAASLMFPWLSPRRQQRMAELFAARRLAIAMRPRGSGGGIILDAKTSISSRE